MQINKLPESFNSNVYQITQDEKGYLWFATERGVSRFDGSKFTNYLFREGLPGSIVYSITSDDNNVLWAATKYNGICKIDEAFVKTIDASPLLRNNPIVIKGKYLYSLNYGYFISVIDTITKKIVKIQFDDAGTRPYYLYKSPSGKII